MRRSGPRSRTARPTVPLRVRRVLRGWLALVAGVAAGNPSGGMLLRNHRPTPDQAPAILAVAVDRSYAWYAVEAHAPVASVERAAATNLAADTAELASALCGSLFVAGNAFDLWTRTHEAALAAVRRSSDSAAEASLLAEFGQLRYEQDRSPRRGRTSSGP
jgi:hypothetical protein